MNRIPNQTTKITSSKNYFSLISLSINGLNSPIKRHKLTDWLGERDPIFCSIQEIHLGVKVWKTIFQANFPKKQAGVAIMILKKIDFKP
jgi:exonuclease III